MKKVIYYASPIVIFPIIFSVLALLDKTDGISGVLPILIYIAFFIFAAMMGSLSTTNKKFDYLMTATVPASCFLTLFIGLLVDEGCDGMPRLSLHHALNMEYYMVWLPIVAIMTVITFVASFKPIRISKIIEK